MKTLTFDAAIEDTRIKLTNASKTIDANQWQSIKIPSTVRFKEYTNVYFIVSLANTLDLNHWRSDIKPNIPWADVAFEERVSGTPWNPGTAWKSWPWAKSAEQFKPERFSHSYAERYWPKFAGVYSDDWLKDATSNAKAIAPKRGVRFPYGDLLNVVMLLDKDPLTRQAYLPVWFPEDTGVVHNERVPCSLGYHFLHRDGKMDITYYIRSCDFIRHFRDDLYMTLRLLLWMINRVNFDVKPGLFTFHCVSMHCFENDL